MQLNKDRRNSNPEYVVIGTVMSPWGYQGHLKIDVATDFPERYSQGAQIFIDGNPMTIETVAWHKGRAIIKLEGLDSDEEAIELKGKTVEIHNSQLYELPQDQYYHFELVGLKVKTVDGDDIGTIKDVMTMSSADIYVVQAKTGEILLPATDEVVKSIDLEAGEMIIDPIDGLLDLNEKK